MKEFFIVYLLLVHLHFFYMYLKDASLKKFFNITYISDNFEEYIISLMLYPLIIIMSFYRYIKKFKIKKLFYIEMSNFEEVDDIKNVIYWIDGNAYWLKSKKFNLYKRIDHKEDITFNFERKGLDSFKDFNELNTYLKSNKVINKFNL